MGMNMVEIVAKAICQELGCEDPDCDCPYTGLDKTEGRQARAAIEAMREPTEEMWKAALHSANCPALPFEEKEALSDFWQAMIDQALKEE